MFVPCDSGLFIPSIRLTISILPVMFPLLSSRWKRLLIRSFNFAAIVGVTSGLTVFVIVGAGFLYHRARKNAKAAEDVEYPAYGVTGPGKDT